MLTAEFVAALTDEQLEEQAAILRAERDRRRLILILEGVRAAVAKVDHEGDTPVAALFETMGFDDGYFLTSNFHILYAEPGAVDGNGKVDGAIDGLITDQYGSDGEGAALAVNLITGAQDFDTYGDTVRDAARAWCQAHYAQTHPTA